MLTKDKGHWLTEPTASKWVYCVHCRMNFHLDRSPKLSEEDPTCEESTVRLMIQEVHDS